MNHRPRKRFGQHFLHDPGVVSRIVAAVAPAAGEHLVEIGPGEGVLTAPLSRAPVTLDAVELDRDLAASLQQRFAGAPNVTIHQADALDFDYGALGEDLRVVGNLPYNISTPLLFHLIGHREAIRDMHFMLQREVVDRMSAAPGGKAYGRLTVMLACSMQVERLFDVPPEAFRPPPRVHSSVVRLTPLEEPLAIADRQLFGALVTSAFSRRRKTLKNALADWLDASAIADAGIDPGLRPERLTPDEFARLAAAAQVDNGDALE
ncbi:MAG: 16S rRNA (adenine(1518)-N(6)/adenine(1519)-N(6))-dimethyltransferase RsmA [Gammaproteobacteria bacterium]|jgi:16S rRNA (adenine1518-N6/adenine1519-N6)-dimethyltransferase